MDHIFLFGSMALLVCTQYIEESKNINLKWCCPSCISCKVSLVKVSHVFLIKYSIYAWLVIFLWDYMFETLL